MPIFRACKDTWFKKLQCCFGESKAQSEAVCMNVLVNNCHVFFKPFLLFLYFLFPYSNTGAAQAEEKIQTGISRRLNMINRPVQIDMRDILNKINYYSCLFIFFVHIPVFPGFPPVQTAGWIMFPSRRRRTSQRLRCSQSEKVKFNPPAVCQCYWTTVLWGITLSLSIFNSSFTQGRSDT